MSQLNIRDIAKKANVSVATVSRFLDPRKRALISQKTRDKLERVIKKYQYTPNRTAQALSRHSTNTIGMLTPFSTDVVKSPYFEGLIAGIIEGIHSLDYDLKWIMVRDEEANNYDYSQLVQKHAVDGIIFLAWRLLPRLVLEVEKKTNLPAVLINDYDPQIRSSIVYCENESGVEELIAHLAEKGYQKIGMLRGPEYNSSDAVQRFNAFKHSLEKLNLKLYPQFLYESDRFEEQFAYDIMKGWLQHGDLPEVLFCANDDLAHGAMRVLREHKIRIPGDLAIAGYDDAPRNEWIVPALTSVRQPTETMGKAAIEILAKLMNGEAKDPIQMKFKPEVVVRSST
jgi:DNA-binding LacI/PurR family transcriptional regulator